MFTSEIPRFVINLDGDVRDRWAEVIVTGHKDVQRVAHEIIADYAYIPDFVRRLLGCVLTYVYRLSGGRYFGEMKAWARAMGWPVGDVVAMNCMYELSHITDIPSIFGCTAGVRWIPRRGMVHVRSLDWPLRNIGCATRLFEFRRKERSFVAVGIAGYVGVLSGMLPGAYSATINWAPPDGVSAGGFGPAFLLREVLETCNTYASAVRTLASAPLATSVFYTVCGTKKGQACVIERTQQDAAIREAEVLVQGNHHVAEKFLENNVDDELLVDSVERTDALERKLRHVRDVEDAAIALDVDPVLNADTCQQMVFLPASGKIQAWRWLD